jgi:oligoendopeptidase F
MQKSVTYEQGRWDLTDVLPSRTGQDYKRALEGLEEDTKRFEALRESLGEMSQDDVTAALRIYERISETVARLSSYAYMLLSQDTQNQGSKSFADSIEELRARVDNRTLFFRLWWTALGDMDAAKVIPEDADFRHFLTLLRKRKPHTLEERVEQVINIKNTTGVSGWVHHYDRTVAAFTYQLKVDGKVLKERGKPKDFVVAEVVRLFMSPDPKLREAAYTALLTKYSLEGKSLGEVYRTLVRDWRNENVDLRHFSTPISARNIENDVSDPAVDALLGVIKRDAHVFQEFFRLKAKMLGMKKMGRFHLYAPVTQKDRKVPYPEAVRTVLSAFDSFDPRFGSLARGVFEQGHVDSQVKRGKETGAFCMPITPKITPYMLLNYAGGTRDVYTMAHESGHAVHDRLASIHSQLTFRAPLVLAETASVFGEMVLFDKSMREEEDENVRRGVLVDRISAMYATIQRQAFLVLFEKEAHSAIDKGATVDKLCEIYASNLRDQFGGSVTVPDLFKSEWSFIPHIYHTPFYCYAYSFGNLLALSLYDTYKEEGKSFVPNYLKILSYGGSANPDSILRDVGIDLTSPAFWESGFRVVSSMVGDLRKSL